MIGVAILAMVLAGEQSAVTTIEQVGTPAGRSALTEQVGPTTRQVLSPLPATRDVTPPAPQVTGERRQAGAGSQINQSKPTAEATPSGSTRAQGRNLRTEALTGEDRCDPQSPVAETAGDACQNVIETRSAEFVSPDVEPLSPEQRLIVTQNAADYEGRDPASATRRLANGEIDVTNAGVAATIMGQSQPPPSHSEPTLPEDMVTNSIVSAIVSGMQP